MIKLVCGVRLSFLESFDRSTRSLARQKKRYRAICRSLSCHRCNIGLYGTCTESLPQKTSTIGQSCWKRWQATAKTKEIWCWWASSSSTKRPSASTSTSPSRSPPLFATNNTETSSKPTKAEEPIRLRAESNGKATCSVTSTTTASQTKGSSMASSTTRTISTEARSARNTETQLWSWRTK